MSPLRSAIERLPLRVRLTLWVAGIAATIQLSVGLVYFLYQRAAINAFFDKHLLSRSEGILSTVRDLMPGLTDQQLQRVAERESRFAMFTGFVITVSDSTGAELATTRTKPVAKPISPEHIREVARLNSIEYMRTAAGPNLLELDPNASMARAVIRAFQGADGAKYVITIGTADTYAQEMLSLVLRSLLILCIPGMGVAATSGWYIAGLAVRPLEEVRQAARSLRPESINVSVPSRRSSPEQSLLENELETARNRLAVAFAAQERFMSNVSHELKTPISVLLTEAQTLNLNGAPSEVREYVRSASEELRRLGSMVDGFLLLTRVREGRSVTHDHPYPLNEVVMESVAHCGRMAAQHHVRLDPRLSEDDIELRVCGNPTLLRTMIDNLIRNAIRFSPKDQSIVVTAWGEQNEAVVSVRDFGAGIPDAIIGRIFDRFVQAPDELRRGRGHGLGLEISQGIAELHGGRISARNREGGGCEFVIRLPKFVDECRDSLPKSKIGTDAA